MNLPKYVPGLVVVVKEADKLETEQKIYPEDFGMFVIAEAFLDHEEWHYTNYDRSVQVHESEIAGIINNGYYVEADRFNGPVPAPEHDPGVDALEELMKQDAAEDAFIKKAQAKHLKELKKKGKKIEVKDGNEEGN